MIALRCSCCHGERCVKYGINQTANNALAVRRVADNIGNIRAPRLIPTQSPQFESRLGDSHSKMNHYPKILVGSKNRYSRNRAQSRNRAVFRFS